MKSLRRILLALIVLYIAIVALVYTQQRRMLFPAPNAYLSPSAVGVPEMSEIEFYCGDDCWATAWWVPPSAPDGEIVMVFHGNGSAVYTNTDIFIDLIAAGHGVWSVGYPGYPGQAEDWGEASEANLVKATMLQFERLQEKNTTNAPINYYGTSLGSGVAAQLARAHPPKRLFLDAPFHSTLDMAKMRMGWLPIDLLMRDKFRSDLALQDIDVPLYWTHGTADQIVPITEGQRLYDSYSGPKQNLIIKGGRHTNIWALGGREFVLVALDND